jgi:hypothetical protein
MIDRLGQQKRIMLTLDCVVVFAKQWLEGVVELIAEVV